MIQPQCAAALLAREQPVLPSATTELCMVCLIFRKGVKEQKESALVGGSMMVPAACGSTSQDPIYPCSPHGACMARGLCQVCRHDHKEQAPRFQLPMRIADSDGTGHDLLDSTLVGAGKGVTDSPQGA